MIHRYGLATIEYMNEGMKVVHTAKVECSFNEIEEMREKIGKVREVTHNGKFVAYTRVISVEEASKIL
jgi:hypothetical protein